jgi:signal transduction histidine kinase
MTRAVYNLLINACQAIEHDHGEITLQAEADEQLEIVVADNGAGIPPDVLPRVFEPFVTTRSEGNGLGLPLVKTIVDAHGGEVRVESKAGEGSRFIVTLPRQ